MTKLHFLFLLAVLLCGVLADTENLEEEIIEEVKEAVKADEPVLKDDNVKPDIPDVAKGNKKDAKPIFSFLAKVIGGLAHVVAHVGSAILGFAAGAISGAAQGVADLVDGTIISAIKGAIHHSGHGLKDKELEAKGWDHPVELKNVGHCNSVSENLCQRMAQKNHDKVPKKNTNGRCRRLGEKSAYKSPHGCFVYKDELWWNAYSSAKPCSEGPKGKTCVCEVCARKTQAGKCCHLPFQYSGSLYGDCTTVGCWFWCTSWCGVADIVTSSATTWERCASKKKDVTSITSVKDAQSRKDQFLRNVAEKVADAVQDRSIPEGIEDDIEIDWNDAEEDKREGGPITGVL